MQWSLAPHPSMHWYTHTRIFFICSTLCSIYYMLHFSAKGWRRRMHTEQRNHQISKCRNQIRPWPRGNELHLAIGLWGKIVHRVVTLGMLLMVLRMQLGLVRMHLWRMLWRSRCLRCLQVQLRDLWDLWDLWDLRWLPLLRHLLNVDRVLRRRALDLWDLLELPLGRCRCQATRAGRQRMQRMRMRSLGRRIRTKPWTRSMAQRLAHGMTQS